MTSIGQKADYVRRAPQTRELHQAGAAGDGCRVHWYNRTAYAISFMRPLCGRRAVHAAKGMTRAEYEDAAAFMRHIIGVECPPPAELLRGGIIGSVDVGEVVRKSASQWFRGPCGLPLKNPRPCEFVPAIGALGYFQWRPGNAADVPPPARWMLSAAPGDVSVRPPAQAQGRLL